MNHILDNQDQANKTGKVYKKYAIILGSLLGGPIVAGYFFANNFNLLGEKEKANKAWIISILTTIVIILIAFLIPENSKIPNQIIPIAYTAAASYLFKTHLEIKTLKFIELGGKVYHWIRVVGIALIGLFFTLSVLFTFVYTDEVIQEQNIESKTYGRQIKHTIEYNKENITETEIDEIANGLTAIEFFDETSETYIYVQKDGITYELLISVLEGTENNEDAIMYYTDLRGLMSDYLPKNDVIVKLVVDYLDNIILTIE